MARIMVVDDATFMRRMLKDILLEKGHEVVAEAANGQEALVQYRQNKPDLVTMDITMPDMDGIEAVKQIMHYDSQAKIIMCSAVGQKTMVLDAIKAGAKDFMVKPFQSDRVIEAIDKMLQ